MDNIKTKIFKNGPIGVLKLIHQKGGRSGTFVIDSKYIEEVKKYKWTIDLDGYAISLCKLRMHKLIMLLDNRYDPSKVVDHISRDISDNRGCNLRMASKSLNAHNSIAINSATGVRGVNFKKDRNKYFAYMSYMQKQISLGQFTNIDDAILARRSAERLLFALFDNGHIE